MSREERLEHRHAARHPGHEPRRVVLRVEGVGIGALGDEEAGDLDVIGGSREQERGPLLVVTCLDVGPGRQRAARSVGIACRGRPQQLAIRVGDRHGRCSTRRRTGRRGPFRCASRRQHECDRGDEDERQGHLTNLTTGRS